MTIVSVDSYSQIMVEYTPDDFHKTTRYTMWRESNGTTAPIFMKDDYWIMSADEIDLVANIRNVHGVDRLRPATRYIEFQIKNNTRNHPSILRHVARLIMAHFFTTEKEAIDFVYADDPRNLLAVDPTVVYA